jgi:nucleoside-diphosphate-sugar epimerase
LLIGAAGFVGSALAAAVRDSGWDLHAATRDNYDTFIGRSFDLVINANGNARRFLADQEPIADFRASAETVYRSCLDFSCRRYAYISTVDVYNDTSRRAETREDAEIDPLRLSPYAFHKWLAERFVMRNDGEWQIFRLAQMVGPGLRKGPVYDLLHGDKIWIHDESELHFLQTHTVANAVLELIKSGAANEVYNVCGVGAVSYGEVRQLFPDQVGVENGATARQMYSIDTERTARLIQLPASQMEVVAFVRGALAEKDPPG